MDLRVEPLAGHDRSHFYSGQPELDRWFRERAGQDERRNVARVFVAVEADDKRRVVGFYSLSSFTIELADLPPGEARKLPRYESLPAALIGRLANDQSVRGQGVGHLLLVHAITKALHAGQSVAAYAIAVDAIDENAAEFYQRFGFRRLRTRPNRLYLTSSTAVQLLQLPPPR